MKQPRSIFPTLKLLLLTCSLIWSALAVESAPSKPATPARPPAPAAGLNETMVPQSVFVSPRSPQQGRDPFFPKSDRPFREYQVIPKSNPPVVVTTELRLQGISGSAERRLAIVNNRTFEVGEEGDVGSGPERVRIRVLEIKADAVVVQFLASGQRREFHLRKGL